MRQRFKLWRHHIEFAGSATHANEGGTGIDAGHTVGHTAHLFAIHRHHLDFAGVGILFHHIEHQIVDGKGGAIGFISAHALHQNGVAHIKYFIVLGFDFHLGDIVGVAVVHRFGHIFFEGGGGGFGVHIVVVHRHTSGVFCAGAS